MECYNRSLLSFIFIPRVLVVDSWTGAGSSAYLETGTLKLANSMASHYSNADKCGAPTSDGHSHAPECAAWRLTLGRYVARLKPRCGSLALSVMWYVLTVSQVGAKARFE